MRLVFAPADVRAQNCQTSGKQPVILSAAILLLMPALITCVRRHQKASEGMRSIRKHQKVAEG